MTAIQKVKGIVAVDVDKLFETGARPQLNHVVPSSLKPSTRTQEPIVDLLTINTAQGITITEILQ